MVAGPRLDPRPNASRLRRGRCRAERRGAWPRRATEAPWALCHYYSHNLDPCRRVASASLARAARVPLPTLTEPRGPAAVLER